MSAAGPGIPWEERTAWKRHRPAGVPVIDPAGSEKPATEPLARRPVPAPPDREIVFEIDVPDEATDEDVKRFVELLARKTDAVYRAAGGAGLRVSGIVATGDPVPVTDPVGGAT